MHMIHKILPTNEHDYTEDFDNHFRVRPVVVAYGLHPFWDEDL